MVSDARVQGEQKRGDDLRQALYVCHQLDTLTRQMHKA